MDGSHLWYKICIYERLESLNEDQLDQVVNFIKNDLNCTIPSTISNHVPSCEQIGKAILFNKNEQLLNTNSLADLWRFVQTLTVNVNNVTKTDTKNSNDHESSHSSVSMKKSLKVKPLIFPLLKLPVDLIIHTSLFLNDKTIIVFERCCRCLYQLTNNTLFISKSNFKTLSVDKLGGRKEAFKMKYISQHPCDFFKFCKLTKLEICYYSDYYNPLKYIAISLKK